MKREMLCKRERILEWMAGQRRPTDQAPPPVLLSVMREQMGERFNQEAFNGLVRDGVIRAEFPEAKRGDSGLQHWNFAHIVVLSTSGEPKC